MTCSGRCRRRSRSHCPLRRADQSGKMMDFIQHQDGCAPLSAGFGPVTLPEAGQCRVRLIASHVGGLLAELLRQLQQ